MNKAVGEGELLYLVSVYRDFESGAFHRDGCVAHCELSGEGSEATVCWHDEEESTADGVAKGPLVALLVAPADPEDFLTRASGSLRVVCLSSVDQRAGARARACWVDGARGAEDSSRSLQTH